MKLSKIRKALEAPKSLQCLLVGWWLLVVGWVACVVEWLDGWKPNAGRSSNSGAACWVRHTAHSGLANMEKCSHSRVSHCGPGHIAHCWVGHTAQGGGGRLSENAYIVDYKL